MAIAFALLIAIATTCVHAVEGRGNEKRMRDRVGRSECSDLYLHRDESFRRTKVYTFFTSGFLNRCLNVGLRSVLTNLMFATDADGRPKAPVTNREIRSRTRRYRQRGFPTSDTSRPKVSKRIGCLIGA